MYRFAGSAYVPYVRKWSSGRGAALAVVLVALLTALTLPAPGAAADSREGEAAARPYSGRPVHFNGWAFDTCEAPSLATMKAWRASSPYRAVGIYFGGRGRGCPRQTNLNKQWVKSVDRMGWFLLPVYVGSQSPCVTVTHKRRYAIGRDPWRQGAAEARDAVVRARWHGMIPGSTLYLDIESYDVGNRACAARTLDFVRAWNRELRRHRYIPGYYSSADSGIAHLERARRAKIGDLPTVVWFARWGKKPSVSGEPSLHPRAWMPHRRIHQYAGNVKESHGGHRLNIDRNRIDALVARTWE
ncbi:hypothetical protein SSPIM334S_02988 [Streptomyces spiroverticillatus]|uniref:DUF1906 domain-containing protein n=1 Tax=Streptomyces finlayi TaxID=67296 RepID=UPI0016747361|nr:DUF1906 domain-containing protein [Streptomyces finlayi]